MIFGTLIDICKAKGGDNFNNTHNRGIILAFAKAQITVVIAE